LDALKEVSNNEPSTGDVTSEAAMNKIAEEEFIAYLEHHDPKCASVYKMLKRGDSAVEIAKQLKLTDRMVRYYRSEAYNLRMQFNAE
jgi:DNA-binding CsgD family transcriptional regulator